MCRPLNMIAVMMGRPYPRIKPNAVTEILAIIILLLIKIMKQFFVYYTYTKEPLYATFNQS